MNRSIPSSPVSLRGFSLLEVLVASAILSIVMMVLLSTLTTSLSLWRNTENKAIADREARASQLLLAQDLANAVVPANLGLWPRVVSSGGVSFLQFLTTKPSEYQPGASDQGDVCYVEYAVVPSPTGVGHELQRMFWGSSRTFSDILSAGFLRGGRRGSGVSTNSDFQSLGLNLLEDNRQAVRGLALEAEANRTNFVVLSKNHPNGDLLPLNGAYAATNYPVALEVNFAVSDPDTLRNTNLRANPKYILRNAGLYSTRFYLPKPPNTP